MGWLFDRRKSNPNSGPTNPDDATLRRSGERDLSEVSEESHANVSGGLNWPANPRMDILDAQIGGRSFAGQPDGNLHLGREPERIDRINSMRTFGHAGPMGTGIDKSGEYMRVGHIPAPGQPIKRQLPIQSTAVDDTVAIPAARIGNPLS